MAIKIAFKRKSTCNYPGEDLRGADSLLSSGIRPPADPKVPPMVLFIFQEIHFWQPTPNFFSFGANIYQL